MRAATCFSGIGAPETSMPGWEWAWSAEIEPFPAAVHAERFPSSANLGDVLAADFLERARAFERLFALVGGPPCQAFSVAGLRGGLADPRGNLSLRWVQIIHAVDPVFSITENVPGWLNTPDNAFGCFLGALVGADDALYPPGGRGWPSAGMVAGPLQRACWRVLDAQFYNVAQRRERVFVVASSRDWADPAAVLFEPKSLRGHPPPRREAGEGVARPLASSSPKSSGYRNDADTADNLIAHTLPILESGKRTGASSTNLKAGDGIGKAGDPMFTLGADSRHAVAFTWKDYGGDAGDLSPTLRAMGHGETWANGGGQVAVAQVYPCLSAHEGGTLTQVPPIQHGMAVRRLLPVEAERLQGFPDEHTAILYRGKPAADGPRYKAIGNAMAVPVLRWLLTRLEAVDAAIFADVARAA